MASKKSKRIFRGAAAFVGGMMTGGVIQRSSLRSRAAAGTAPASMQNALQSAVIAADNNPASAAVQIAQAMARPSPVAEVSFAGAQATPAVDIATTAAARAWYAKPGNIIGMVVLLIILVVVLKKLKVF